MTAVISTETLIAEAESRVGTDTVHAATDADVVDGVRPRLVAQPHSAEKLAALPWLGRQVLACMCSCAVQGRN